MIIDSFVVYIREIVIEHRVWGVFFATLIEQIIGLIPSSLVSIMAGFFLLPPQGLFLDVLWQSIFIIAIPVTLGIIIGSLFFYLLGFLGGKPVIEKSKKWLGLKWEDVEKIRKKIDIKKSSEIIIFILWIIPVVPGVAISVLCGIIRYSLLKFIIIVTLGSFLRAIVTALLGWQAGELYYVKIEQITVIENYFLIGLTFLILISIAILFYKKNKG